MYFIIWFIIMIVGSLGDCFQLIDLTHPITFNRTYYKKDQLKYERLEDYNMNTPAGNWFTTYSMKFSEHTSTHIDAPYHSLQTGWKLHEIPTKNFVLISAVLVDVFQEAEITGSDFLVTKTHFLEWERQYGKIPSGSVVLVRTGWETKYFNPAEYLGKDYLNGEFNFPAFDASAAYFLSHERNIIGVGIDTFSIDSPTSDKKTESHQLFASKNIYMLENIKNLHLLPPRNFHLWVMPLKMEDASGAPVRLIAILDH